MPIMYTIGRFASIGRVSVRMLRHYDEIGLLVPAKVDARSGYRSYAPSQLAELAEIMRLRGLGLGLADTAAVVRAGADDPVSRERLISQMRAETDGARCEFGNISGLGTSWKTLGTCTVNGETRKANITLVRTGDVLVWSSENGTTKYLRCPN